MRIAERSAESRTLSGTTSWLTLPDITTDWAHTSMEPHEVMIPPGKCVFYWLGCEDKRWRRNYCYAHYTEARATGDLAGPLRTPQNMCTECRVHRSSPKSELCSGCRNRKKTAEYYKDNAETVKERQRQYRQENHERERLRKLAWREANRPKARASVNRWNAKQREMARNGSSTTSDA